MSSSSHGAPHPLSVSSSASFLGSHRGANPTQNIRTLLESSRSAAQLGQVVPGEQFPQCLLHDLNGVDLPTGRWTRPLSSLSLAGVIQSLNVIQRQIDRVLTAEAFSSSRYYEDLRSEHVKIGRLISSLRHYEATYHPPASIFSLLGSAGAIQGKDVVYEGWLKKKSPSNRHLWQIRYFVLRMGTGSAPSSGPTEMPDERDERGRSFKLTMMTTGWVLLYFPSQKEALSNTGGRGIRIEDLQSVEVAAKGQGAEHGCRLNIIMKNKRRFELQTEKAAECRAWHSHIFACLTKAQEEAKARGSENQAAPLTGIGRESGVRTLGMVLASGAYPPRDSTRDSTRESTRDSTRDSAKDSFREARDSSEADDPDHSRERSLIKAPSFRFFTAKPKEIEKSSYFTLSSTTIEPYKPVAAKDYTPSPWVERNKLLRKKTEGTNTATLPGSPEVGSHGPPSLSVSPSAPSSSPSQPPTSPRSNPAPPSSPPPPPPTVSPPARSQPNNHSAPLTPNPLLFKATKDGTWVAYEGWLKKKSSNNRHLWQARYFVLIGGEEVLTYYPSQADHQALKSPRTIKCHEIVAVEVPSHGKGSETGCRINVKMGFMRIYELMAETSVEAKRLQFLLEESSQRARDKEVRKHSMVDIVPQLQPPNRTPNKVQPPPLPTTVKPTATSPPPPSKPPPDRPAPPSSPPPATPTSPRGTPAASPISPTKTPSSPPNRSPPPPRRAPPPPRPTGAGDFPSSVPSSSALQSAVDDDEPAAFTSSFTSASMLAPQQSHSQLYNSVSSPMLVKPPRLASPKPNYR